MVFYLVLLGFIQSCWVILSFLPSYTEILLFYLVNRVFIGLLTETRDEIDNRPDLGLLADGAVVGGGRRRFGGLGADSAGVWNGQAQRFETRQ